MLNSWIDALLGLPPTIDGDRSTLVFNNTPPPDSGITGVISDVPSSRITLSGMKRSRRCFPGVRGASGTGGNIIIEVGIRGTMHPSSDWHPSSSSSTGVVDDADVTADTGEKSEGRLGGTVEEVGLNTVMAGKGCVFGLGWLVSDGLTSSSSLQLLSFCREGGRSPSSSLSRGDTGQLPAAAGEADRVVGMEVQDWAGEIDTRTSDDDTEDTAVDEHSDSALTAEP